ncbi:MAG TPA: TetR family transcriptional regulator [Streptomyces sp.]|uniref:TetR/AcrR family transcriptional regulator n=1 Tax=Streptomyces sp. TaxID=1931 RepID=UPI002D400BE3|nr:TetR family transcriptional regulator [Streptomyces sp.]HZG07046.1 TetR family transcriptional regulator [Streptomyces sp.]
MAPRTARTATRTAARTDLIADTAIDLLAERGLRGLTHRAVDEAAGLPQGSTSNHARTREALLEAAVRRLAVREAQVLAPREMPGPGDGPGALAEALALALHRYLTHHRRLAIARYELALEATRRPALRAIYDRTGTSAFREPLVTMMAAAGSAEPERHALSLIAWCDGVMFSCTAGSYHSTVPTLEELRAGLGELLRGALGR